MSQKNNTDEFDELDPKEKSLLKRLRHRHQWGEVTIEMRGGLPDRIVKVVEYKKL